LNTAAYIIINLLLFTSWYILLFKKRELLSLADRITGAFVLSLTQIIATEMLLGVLFKKLSAAPLFFFNILISTGVLFLAFLIDRDPGYIDKPNFIASLFNELSNKIIDFSRIMKNDWILLCIFCLFLISLCWIMLVGYLFPSYAWDALWYHLPIVGHIMQNGAIQEIANHSFIDQFMNIFPKNIELFFLWNIIFLQNDIVTDLSQLIFTVIGVCTVYNIAVKLGVTEKHAMYSGLLFFFTPVIILQSTTNYVDVATAVLFLIAVNYLMYGNSGHVPNDKMETLLLRKRKLTVFFAGLTTGILFGSKGSGPLFVIVLSAVFLIQEFVHHFRCLPLKKRNVFKITVKFYFLFFAVPVLFIGGYWYIKNWILYGNPVHPMEISLFNITIFKGMYKGIIEPAPEVIKRLSFLTRPLYVWIENTEYYLYDSRLGGLGPIWFILFLPGLLFSLVFAGIRKKYDFLAVFLIFAAAFLLYPRNWTPRYVIFIVGLGALSFGLLLDYFSARERVLRVIALFFVGYTFFAAQSPCVTPEQIKKFIQLPAHERTIARHAPFNIDLHARQEYGYWIWISNNIAKGDTLAYTFEPLFLSPLWNNSYSSKIAYVKSDAYKEWLESLRDSNVTYILVRRHSPEDKWIEKERSVYYSLRWFGNVTEKFKVVYMDRNYKIIEFMEGKKKKAER
jgi:hypothetical protein